jgi:hypothetical protein
VIFFARESAIILMPVAILSLLERTNDFYLSGNYGRMLNVMEHVISISFFSNNPN